MVSSEGDVPIELLREAARTRAQETSLRETAAEIGLSWSGLRTFLAGTNPHLTTRRKLATWFDVRRDAPSGRLRRAAAQTALSLLVTELPAEVQPELTEGILAVIERSYRKAELSPPTWIAELRRRGDEKTG